MKKETWVFVDALVFPAHPKFEFRYKGRRVSCIASHYIKPVTEKENRQELRKAYRALRKLVGDDGSVFELSVHEHDN